jgi:alpha-mannosidase
MPTVHLICNAHLDPVWQWRWEEGAAEAVATFRTAVALLREHPRLIFNHNEAVLYQWVERLDPRLFEEIRKLAAEGRWCISGGWYLQPDVNLPGTESLIRQIVVGRRYFADRFGAAPRVAYNFDSFGHSGGLPQILKHAGYRMYIHMRPQENERALPSDLYRWRGVDGSEVIGLRISVGLYHTERDNLLQRLEAGAARSLELDRDVPVFWGLGDHGGGATREDLRTIDDFAARQSRVKVVHSTTERLFDCLAEAAKTAPVVEGDIQRVFTGCYTSLSRLKRRARRSLGEVVQAETMRAASWWLLGQTYPAEDLDRAWRGHLFNDFHDILTGSCIEPAEQDALDLYGKVSASARRLRLEAAAAFAGQAGGEAYVPVTLLNDQPSAGHFPVEVECMLDYRPRLDKPWHLHLFSLDGQEVVCQEEQPESLLPYNGWRRKICFLAEGKGVGASYYNIEAHEGESKPAFREPALGHTLDRKSGLVSSLSAGSCLDVLSGRLFEPLVIEDQGDSWGAGVWSYRKVVGRFKPLGRPRIVERGPVRSMTESVLAFARSRIVFRTYAYAEWPVLEFRLRVHWAEAGKRLKLSMPTVFRDPRLLAEIPGGAIARPADGEEHVHGAWLCLSGQVEGKDVALGLVNNGQHGFDLLRGELRLSVLRGAPYCHDKGYDLGEFPERTYMDQGIHDIRLLATAGETAQVLGALPALAEWLNAPPTSFAHLSLGTFGASDHSARESGVLLKIEAGNIRLLACKRSWDGEALIVRLQEAVGIPTQAKVEIARPLMIDPASRKTSSAPIPCMVAFRPFELKTLRIDRSGGWCEAGLIDDMPNSK